MTDLPVFSIADVEAQPTIDLPEFSNDDAVDLGLLAVEVIRERNVSLAVRILLRGDVVFQLPFSWSSDVCGSRVRSRAATLATGHHVKRRSWG